MPYEAEELRPKFGELGFIYINEKVLPKEKIVYFKFYHKF